MGASHNSSRIGTQDDKDDSNNEGHWLPLASLDAGWQEFLSPDLVRVVFDACKTLVNTFHYPARWWEMHEGVEREDRSPPKAPRVEHLVSGPRP